HAISLPAGLCHNVLPARIFPVIPPTMPLPAWRKDLARKRQSLAAACQGYGDAGLELDAPNDQRSLDAGNVGCRGQLLDDEILEHREVRGNTLEQEIRFT